MRYKLFQLLTSMLLTCLALAGQSADTYTGYSFAADGGTLYAYTTTDGSMSSGSCSHTYSVDTVLSGPPGTTEIGGGNGSTTQPANTPVTLTSNAQISSSVPGAYVLGSSRSAYCYCILELFYNDPYSTQTLLTAEPPTINPGGVVVYPSTGGTSASIRVGTSGVLAIYGTNLTAGGQDLNPTVAVSNGVVLNGFQSIGNGQLNVNYNALSAVLGTATLLITNNVPPTASAPIPVVPYVYPQSFINKLWSGVLSYGSIDPNTGNFDNVQLSQDAYNYLLSSGYISAAQAGGAVAARIEIPGVGEVVFAIVVVYVTYQAIEALSTWVESRGNHDPAIVQTLGQQEQGRAMVREHAQLQILLRISNGKLSIRVGNGPDRSTGIGLIGI